MEAEKMSNVAKVDKLDCNQAVGTLSLTIIRAVGLPEKHLIGKNHPYVKVFLLDDTSSKDAHEEGITIRKQPATEGVDGQDPFFGSEYDIQLKGDRQILQIELWSKGMLRDSKLGALTVPITDLIKRAFDCAHIPLAYTLSGDSNEQPGTLFISLGYESQPSFRPSSSRANETTTAGENKDTDFSSKEMPSELGPPMSSNISREGQRDMDTTTSTSSAKTFPISSFPIASASDKQGNQRGTDESTFPSQSVRYGVDQPYHEVHNHPVSSAIDMSGGSGAKSTSQAFDSSNTQKDHKTTAMGSEPDKHSSVYNSLYNVSNQLNTAPDGTKADSSSVSTIRAPDTSYNLGTNYKPESVLDAGEWGSSNVGSTGSRIQDSDTKPVEKKDDTTFESSTTRFGSRDMEHGKDVDLSKNDVIGTHINDKLPSINIGTSRWGSADTSYDVSDQGKSFGSTTNFSSTPSKDVDRYKMDVGSKTDTGLGSSSYGGSNVVGSLSSDIGTASNIGSNDFSSTSKDFDRSSFNATSKTDTDLGSNSYGGSKFSSDIDNKDTSLLDKDKYHSTVWGKDNLGSGLSAPSTTNDSSSGKSTWAEEILHNKYKDPASDVQKKQQPWATPAVDPLDPSVGVKDLQDSLKYMSVGEDKPGSTNLSFDQQQGVHHDLPQEVSDRLHRHPGYGKHQTAEYRESDEQSELQSRQQGLGNKPVDDKLK